MWGNTFGEFKAGDSGWTVRVEAVVRHQSGFYHGLEFSQLTSADKDAIDAACAGPVVGDVRKNSV